MLDLRSARHWARDLQNLALRSGAVCVDATMGNGADTLFLSRAVGQEGIVYAFDVQQQALAQTRKRLLEADAPDNVRLLLAGHERMRDYVREPADLIVFNLGWLPGGDKRITTRMETTLAALEQAVDLLREDGGLVTLCAYPGHEEGKRELQRIAQWAAELPPTGYQTLACGYLNQSAAPALIAIVKLRQRPEA